jgi:hypothetical protein
VLASSASLEGRRPGCCPSFEARKSAHLRMTARALERQCETNFGAAWEGSAVIPGRCEASNPEFKDSPMCNCTSGNLEIPGLVLRTIPE